MVTPHTRSIRVACATGAPRAHPRERGRRRGVADHPEFSHWRVVADHPESGRERVVADHPESGRHRVVDDHPGSGRHRVVDDHPGSKPLGVAVIRTMMQLDDDQWVAAREQARLERLSLAAFVRKAIDESSSLAPNRSATRQTAGSRRDRRALRGLAADQARMARPMRPGVGSGAPRCWLDEPLEENRPTTSRRNGDGDRAQGVTALIDTTALLALLDGQSPGAPDDAPRVRAGARHARADRRHRLRGRGDDRRRATTSGGRRR